MFKIIAVCMTGVGAFTVLPLGDMPQDRDDCLSRCERAYRGEVESCLGLVSDKMRQGCYRRVGLRKDQCIDTCNRTPFDELHDLTGPCRDPRGACAERCCTTFSNDTLACARKADETERWSCYET